MSETLTHPVPLRESFDGDIRAALERHLIDDHVVPHRRAGLRQQLEAVARCGRRQEACL